MKKRPGTILRKLRRLWCYLRGIHYMEVHGMGRGVNDNGKRYNLIIGDDLEEKG